MPGARVEHIPTSCKACVASLIPLSVTLRLSILQEHEDDNVKINQLVFIPTQCSSVRQTKPRADRTWQLSFFSSLFFSHHFQISVRHWQMSNVPKAARTMELHQPAEENGQICPFIHPSLFMSLSCWIFPELSLSNPPIQTHCFAFM